VPLILVLGNPYSGQPIKKEKGGVVDDLTLDTDLLKMKPSIFGNPDVVSPSVGANPSDYGKDFKGALFVLSHGGADNVAGIRRADVVAKLIEGRYGSNLLSGKTIIFIGCEVAQGQFLKQIADKLGHEQQVDEAKVLGAEKETFILQSGKIRVLNFVQTAHQGSQAVSNLTRGKIPPDIKDTCLLTRGSGWKGFLTHKNSVATVIEDAAVRGLILAYS
jgi:hypothetical protein